MSTTMVHVRVDEKTKARAARTLAEMGLSVSDAVRMLLVRVATEKALPFEVKVPNPTTVEAMRAAGQGKGKRHRSADALFKDLIIAYPDQRRSVPPRCEAGAKARQGHGEIREVILLLVEGNPLAPRYEDHALSGDWRRHRDCHIEPDWLLIYKVDGDDLYLVRTGTHSDLF